MRTASLLSSTAHVSHGIWGIMMGAALASAVTAPPKIQQPVFDLEALKMVGLAGDFSGVSEYEYEGQRQLSSYEEGKESLLSQLPNGLFTSLAGADGQINAMCLYEDNGVEKIMLGGSFTSIQETAANGLALYNPENGEVEQVGGFEGKVNALLCDKETNTVYVGGSFSHNDSTNAMAWENGAWKTFTFEGFSGPVNTIAKSSNQTILFGGAFGGLQKFVAPITKHAQTVNIVSSVIEATQTNDQSGFNDPNQITCTNDTSKQWLLRDGQVGAWTANFRFMIRPTKLRLINANHEGRGTRDFRVTAFPINGIMNMTYTDPETKERRYCEASCPLAQTDAPQDFEFVNVIGMDALRLDILGFYGPGGGLSSVQLYQDEIFTYADPKFNEPVCAPQGTRSSSDTQGPWQPLDPDSGTDAYMTADLDASTIQNTQIVFTPHVQESGDYSVKMFTPGCLQEGTCFVRGKVEVSGIYEKGGAVVTHTYMQTNDFDKYDVVYQGRVDPADDTFRPQVTLRPAPDQPHEQVRIVGQKVQFQLLARDNDEEQEDDDEGSSSGKDARLNGIYEYNPADTKTPKPSSSRINVAGLSLQNGASVRNIIVKGDTAYVSGNFTDKENRFSHFMTIDKDGNIGNVREGGLGGPVVSMILQGDLLYLAGNFTQTRDKSTNGAMYIVAYDTNTNEWSALGGGVNAPVTDVSFVNINVGGEAKSGIAVSGSFTSIQPTDEDSVGTKVNGFAVWIPEEKKWLSTEDADLAVSGVISGYIKVNDREIYSGSVSSTQLASSGMVYLKAQEGLELEPSPFRFTQQSLSRKRAVEEAQIKNGVSTGIFFEDSKNGDKRIGVLGGNFEAEGKDGNIRNLAFIDTESQEVTGPSTDLSAESNVLAITYSKKYETIWVGGKIEGQDGLSGVAVYNMGDLKLAERQPPGITTENATAGIFAIAERPGSSDMYVAGDFESAGDLECRHLCRYDQDTNQWRVATQTAPGIIHTMKWLDGDRLLVGGEMRLNDTDVYLAVFDTRSSNFIAHDGNVDAIPGPVTSLIVLEDNSETYVAGQSASDGKPFVMRHKTGEDFIDFPHDFDNTSVITDIEVLTLSEDSPKPESGTIQNDRVLLVAGALSIRDFGNASVVTYDGKDWKPFLLTTAADGSPGIVSSFFSLEAPNFNRRKDPMKKGYVILISLAIALALVFLIVVAGVAASYIRRRREGYVPAPTLAGAEKSTAQMQNRLPPQDLFSHGPQTGRPPML